MKFLNQHFKAKLCPFCDSSLSEMRPSAGGWGFAVFCTRCKAYGPKAQSEQEAYSLWQDRKNVGNRSKDRDEEPSK